MTLVQPTVLEKEPGKRSAGDTVQISAKSERQECAHQRGLEARGQHTSTYAATGASEGQGEKALSGFGKAAWAPASPRETIRMLTMEIRAKEKSQK